MVVTGIKPGESIVMRRTIEAGALQEVEIFGDSLESKTNRH